MGQAAEAQRCACCSGYGSGVVQESLLADGPGTPRKPPGNVGEAKMLQRRPPGLKDLLLQKDNPGANTICLPTAAALSDRVHAGAAICSGGTGGSDAVPLLNLNGADEGAKQIVRASSDSALDKGGTNDGLSGLEWAKTVGRGENKPDDSWAKDLARELKGTPMRNRQGPAGSDTVEEEDDAWKEDDVSPKGSQQNKPVLKNQVSSLGGAEPFPSLLRGPSTLAEAGDEHAKHRGKSACCLPFRRKGLSKKTQRRIANIFENIASSGANGKFAREDAEAGLMDCFGAEATEAMAASDNTAGSISLPEFMDICARLKFSGYTEKDILDQLDDLLQRRMEDCNARQFMAGMS